jgi:hypothetical protein
VTYLTGQTDHGLSERREHTQLQSQADHMALQVKDSPTSCKHGSPIPALPVNACWIREARAIRKQNQSTLMLLEQMANYVHARGARLNSIPQPGFQA